MRAYYLKGLAFIIQIIFLLIINQIGYQIVHFFDIPIPGNVVGMLILFFLLFTKVVRLEWIEAASGFLLKHFAFFFVPICVSLIGYGSIFLKNAVGFTVSLPVSLVLGFYVTGKITEYTAKKEMNTDE